MKLRVKLGLLLPLASTFCLSHSAAQDLNGLKIGISKSDLCALVNQTSNYTLQSETSCPGIDDRVVIATRPSQFPSLKAVTVAFDHSGLVSAIWGAFPSSSFDSAYLNGVKKFGKPTWQKEYTAGNDGANFANKFVYWHTKTADIYLEQQNKLEDGNMTGWLAMNSPAPYAIIPPASFALWWESNGNRVPADSLGTKITLGPER